MIRKFHHNVLGNAAPRPSGNEGNSRAMETEMGKIKPPEKAHPIKPGQTTLFKWEAPEDSLPRVHELFYHRPDGWIDLDSERTASAALRFLYNDFFGRPVDPSPFNRGDKVMPQTTNKPRTKGGTRSHLAQALATLDTWQREELLYVVQQLYLKHHCNIDRLGWNELSDLMQNALCNAMGDKEFVAWLERNVT